MTATGPGVDLWMPVWIQERRAKASTLTHLEHSALSFLTMLLWENGGSVPNDPAWIAKQLKLTSEQWVDVRGSLLADCEVGGSEITHPKIKAEHAKAVENRKQKIAAGKASAEARAIQRQGNARSTDVATIVATDAQPRAGKGPGEGAGPFQGAVIHKGDPAEKPPLRVVEGGQ